MPRNFRFRRNNHKPKPPFENWASCTHLRSFKLGYEQTKYSHRYVVCTSDLSSSSIVLSIVVHDPDAIVYGRSLHEYLEREFNLAATFLGGDFSGLDSKVFLQCSPIKLLAAMATTSSLLSPVLLFEAKTFEFVEVQIISRAANLSQVPIVS